MASIRRPGTASLATLLGLTACLVAAHRLAPEWSRSVGLDLWNYRALTADRQDSDDRRSALDLLAERNARRRAAADQSAARLVRGEAPLEDVAAELLDLFAEDQGSHTCLATRHPEVRDPRLLYARHAIDRAARLPDDPGEQAAVRERLENEYCALTARWAGQGR